MSLIAELKRRSVFKVGAAYLVVAWIVVQAASIALPAFDAPPGLLRAFILCLMLGFPAALVLAWMFDLTPDGVKVETSKKGTKRMFAIAIAFAVLAFGWYFVGQPALHSGESDLHSVAVLPFVNMSNDPNQEFFSDGIAEEVLNRLAQFPDLKVAARTSAFQFKGKNLDIADIGRQLKVAHVLEGSVRKEGGKLRITAQLIDAASGYHLWSQTFDRDAADVFRVQDEISMAIANALEAKLSGRAVAQTQTRSLDPAAYDDYLQGRALLAKRSGDNLGKAVAAFDRAIARDPTYSPAHSGRAFAIAIHPFWVPSVPLIEALAQARAGAEDSLRLDAGNAEGYMIRAVTEITSHESEAALADMARAAALAPGSIDVFNFYGDLLYFVGDLRGAERFKRQAMALDPLAFVHPMNLSWTLSSQGRYAEAESLVQRAVAMSDGYDARYFLFWIQLRSGRIEAAGQTNATQCERDPSALLYCLAPRAALWAAIGRKREASAEIDALAARNLSGKHPVMRHSDLVSIYAHDLHDIPKATAQVRLLILSPDWFTMSPLLNAPGGAKLPEEISTDAAWLAAWNDPRLAEQMAAYRENLAAFRAGK